VPDLPDFGRLWSVAISATEVAVTRAKPSWNMPPADVALSSSTSYVTTPVPLPMTARALAPVRDELMFTSHVRAAVVPVTP
jgi:hypothetical protein